MMNTSDLLKRSFNGKLADAEIDAVANVLANPDYMGDRYPLIQILGRAFAIRYESIIAPFLHSPDNPMLARISLQVLCRYFKLTSKYRDQLLEFCNHVDWDRYQDIRGVALSLAGTYLKKINDSGLASSVLRAYSQDITSDHDVLAKNMAYRAMLESLGIPLRQLRSPESMFKNPSYDESLVSKFGKQKVVHNGA